MQVVTFTSISHQVETLVGSLSYYLWLWLQPTIYDLYSLPWL